jgi:hypothetical protein
MVAVFRGLQARWRALKPQLPTRNDGEMCRDLFDFGEQVSAAAKKGTSSAVEREPGVGLRSGLRWGAERGKKLTASSSLRPDCPRF